jgi:endonuclease III
MVNIGRIFSILDDFLVDYQVPVVDLIRVQKGSSYKILVATILSARTKDETTSVVCERLFKEVPTLKDLDKKSEEEIRDLIYPVGFYKNKAKFLKDLPGAVDRQFKGVIPDTIDELVTLPGVGRKTANLVLVQAFNKPAICVDIHVHRIMNRLGYLRSKTPLETEIRLRSKLPREYWIRVNTYFVMLGQSICRPISPKCTICPIKDECRRIKVKKV